MIAVDTNVLARLLLRDDETQYRKAVRLFGDGRDYTAPPTVMLELVWVLGSYGYSREEIAAALNSLLELPNFKPKSRAAIGTALSWYEAGTDFGDALASVTVATGPSGGGTRTGVIELDFDLSGADRYTRLQFTPNLSASATDVAELSAVYILAGATDDPVTASVV